MYVQRLALMVYRRRLAGPKVFLRMMEALAQQTRRHGAHADPASAYPGTSKRREPYLRKAGAFGNNVTTLCTPAAATARAGLT